MTAKGKINASKLQINDWIIVETRSNGTVHNSSTKTGEFVSVVRVTGKAFRAASGPYERQGKYIIETSAGSFEAGPIQTMWLAPEDAAGVKRAHAEAKLEDAARTVEAAERSASEMAQAQHDQTENWLAAHRAKGTPRTQWSPVEDGRLADHEEAWTMNLRDDSLDIIVPAVMTDEEAAEAATLPQLPEDTGSTVVGLLERVWARIREGHPELPQVVIVTGSGEGTKWGHFRADSWKVREEGADQRKHELFLASEALAKGSHQVLQTMLHEAAHTLAKVRGQQDTSRQGRWHNQVFRKTAEEMGLEHRGSQADKGHGFAFVTLRGGTKDRYADLLAELDQRIKLTGLLPGWLGGSKDGEEDDKGGERMTGRPAAGSEGSTGGNLKLVCMCEEPNIIRASKKVAEKMTIRCDDCEQLFFTA